MWVRRVSDGLRRRFFSALKAEQRERKWYPSRDAARAGVFDYIERYYNPIRRHSTPGYPEPIDFEQHALDRERIA